MSTIFSSKQVRGKGRGKFLGFPTVNLAIPEDFVLEEGIYAVWTTIGTNRYKGALHFGPVPTYAEVERSLEVFLLDVTGGDLGDLRDQPITIEIVQLLRGVLKFNSPAELVTQMTHDVQKVRNILK